MEDTQSVSVLLDSATSKIQQLQQAFAELESHRAVTLNLKWKELEAHFHGLEKSLKRRFDELEDQEKEYETKTLEAQEILEKRKAAVVAKELECLEKLQEKRDSAVFAISKAREKYRKVLPVDCSVAASEFNGLVNLEGKIPEDMTSEEVSSENMKSSVEEGSLELKENGYAEVTSSPQLVKLCQNMDSEGLHNFISDNRKNLATIREEIPLALRVSPDPAGLVLDSLNNFYRGDLSSLDAKKDSGLLGLRRTCIMLLECLSILLTSLDYGSVSNIISEQVKARAKVIAAEWKPKLGELELDMSNGNSLEAHAFLQLLDTFCIASDFDVEELSKLVPLVSRRRQVADLCRSLGLSDRMPGVIRVLISSGRQIDAVNLAFAFELTEQFSPIALLKSYLKEASKAVSPKPGNVSPGHGSPPSPSAQIEVSERELAAFKAVIKCVEEHKLESQYPLDSLQKRVIQLEKAKAEKKRGNEVAKPQPKRPRASNPGNGPRMANPVSDRGPPYAMPTADRYAPPQYMFDNRPYVYPADAHCNPLFGPAAAYGLPPAPHHSNYFGNGYQYPPHQATYLH